ncbi:dTMP kinase [Alginatibacterium sediminis]|uniref:Thymidylate kinase n=1 Tax=Alginatibacterium sediminis TaxID=2164068 RepID=A0A420EHJ1_9ALTE|nr:dTMP kinase [Alginatibacterium sediminis]RKF20127.1 dTMP kinase [Alginatibacterium sediminis]
MTLAGKFIVIEGLEGAGKSSAIESIGECLRRNGIGFVNTREPGGTAMAEQLRDMIKHGFEGEMPSTASEVLMMYAARCQLVEQVIRPSLKQGDWVIGDRHDLSSRAYQGGGRGIALQELDTIRQFAIGNFEPDLTVYLDIDPSLGLSRARSRGSLDRIEQQQLDFFERARVVYLDAVASNPKVVKVDASLDMRAVQEQIITEVQTFIDQN